MPTPPPPSTSALEQIPGVLHGSFALERELPAPPDRVFAAFSELSLRRQWFFRLPLDPGTAHHELDFRVGGQEIAGGTFTANGPVERLEYTSTFLDIVSGKRIVYSSELVLNGRRRSASLVIVGLGPTASGARMTYIEHYILLAFEGDGQADVAHQQAGVQLMLTGLKALLERQSTVCTERAL